MPSYPDSVSQIEALREQFSGQDYPGAKECADELITLPTHPYVTPKDMGKILQLIGNRSCLK